LVGQGRSGGAGLGDEQLAEPRPLDAGQRALADGVADDERNQDECRGFGVDEQEERYAPEDADRAAQQVDRKSAAPRRPGAALPAYADWPAAPCEDTSRTPRTVWETSFPARKSPTGASGVAAGVSRGRCGGG
jgi:hypothetical protein